MAERIDHPTAGMLDFDIEIVSAPQAPDQVTVVHTVQADSPTAQVLPLLTSWDVDAEARR